MRRSDIKPNVRTYTALITGEHSTSLPSKLRFVMTVWLGGAAGQQAGGT